MEPYCVFFVSLITPIYKSPWSNDRIQKDSLHKSNEWDVVSEFAILAQIWSKIVTLKKVDFWVFADYQLQSVTV